MKANEQSAKPLPPQKSGFFATLRASLHARGRSAPSHRRLALAACLAATGLALAAAPAQAAPPNFCPSGSAAGHCADPSGVAVDQSNGTVYVGEVNNSRVSEFEADGSFLRAFGYGVSNGANEPQTCTTLCIQGLFSGLRPSALAVDSSGDVYAAAPGNGRVEEYSSAGQFSLMFGGGVLEGGATGTGNLTAGSATVTAFATTAGTFLPGEKITGAGIPAATTIVGGQEGTITLSQPATATATGVALTVPTPPANNPNNEVQTIALGGAPSGGTFSLEFSSSRIGGAVTATTVSGSPSVSSVAEAVGTGNLTAGSTELTAFNNSRGISVRQSQTITGVGIPPNTTFLGFMGNQTGLVLSQPATATATGVALSVSAAGTGTITAGSNIVTVETGREAIENGMTITGAGIPAGTTIKESDKDSGKLTLSANATASATATALTATYRVPLAPGQAVSGPGIPLGATVASVGANGSFTLSANATASVSGVGLHIGIPSAASAAALQSMLEGLAAIGAGNVEVSGPAGGPWVVEFKGRFADTNVNQLHVDGSGLTPSGTATATTTLEGASAPEVCTKAEREEGYLCKPGAPGTSAGRFNNERIPLALDPSGDVWAGDVNRLERFSSAGEYLSEVKLPGAGQIQSLAVDASGDFYVISFNVNPETLVREPVPGVQKFDPSGALLETLDASGHPHALALDPAGGNLFVGDCPDGTSVNSPCPGYTLLRFDPSGAQTEAFGAGEVIGHPVGNGLAFGDSAQRLYVVGPGPGDTSAAQAFAPPPPGPLVESGSSQATAVKKLSATLNAEVNPEGKATTYHFQYVDQHSFQTEAGFAGPHTVTTSPESASIGADFAFHSASKPISSLEPATTYRFRVVAHNEKGTAEGERDEAGEEVPRSFTTLPPAAIDSTGAAEVSADSATLEAEINPLGDATSYRFEYLTAAEFQANGESFSGPDPATSVPVPDAPLGAGQEDVAVSQHLQGLSPHTAYRYRALIRNAVSEAHGGPFPGPTRAFTTQSFASLGLPDHRAWEQASPVDKHGADLLELGGNGLIQASASGEAIAYLATAPTEAEPQGNANETQVISARGQAGWTSRDFVSPHTTETTVSANAGQEYRFLSSDLSLGLVHPFGGFEPSISPAASAATPFLRTDFPAADPTAFCAESCYRPLVTGCPPAGEPCPPAVEAAANVPLGTKFGTTGKCPGLFCGPDFLAATPDLSHVVLGSGPLTEAAPQGNGLYEWTAAAPPSEQLRLLSVLPGGEPVAAGGGAALGFANQNARNAISADGSRVVFEAFTHLYLRYNATAQQSQIAAGQCTEPAKACTVQLDALQGGPGGAQAPAPRFQTASADGSRVFFTDTQQLTPGAGGGRDLYECEMVEAAGQLHCELTDLTPAAGEPAAVQGLAFGASEDGSSIYFVANGVLANNTVNNGGGGEEARPGGCLSGFSQGQQSPAATCNLYRRHDGATRLVAVLSGADSRDWASGESIDSLTARVSPSGRWLAFMSQRPLSGYDNRDAVNGKTDQEVYLYDAAANGGEGKLICASCNPTGARPAGRNLGAGGGIGEGPQFWAAANVPGWSSYVVSRARYQPRYLSDSGRLFFNSSDALVPADTNGAEDVYQYEPPQGAEEAPPSDTCTAESPTYSPASAGCVDLISSGTSPQGSTFLDASESGEDVFFLTNAQLSNTDTDTSHDVYDARSGGGFPAAVKPVECSGDACQQPAVPPNDATPGSLTFHGAGNVHEPPAKPRCAKGKVRSRGKCVARNHKKKAHKAHRRHANSSKGSGK